MPPKGRKRKREVDTSAITTAVKSARRHTCPEEGPQNLCGQSTVRDVQVVIADFLNQSRLGHKQDTLVPHLEGLGVTCLEDLIDVEREDMKEVGLTVIETNRFFRYINEQLRVPVSLHGNQPRASTFIASSFHESSPVPLTPPRLVTSTPHTPQVSPSPARIGIPATVPVTHPFSSVHTPTPSVGIMQSPQRLQETPTCMTLHLPAVSPTPLGSSLNPVTTGLPSPIPMNDDPYVGSVTPPVQVTTGPPVVADSSPMETSLMQVRYILCSGLFSSDVQEKVVFNMDPSSTAMKDLYGLISHAENISEGFTLELFSQEGYPLSANEFTEHCTLERWGVSNSDIFYVFVRREDQPNPRRFMDLPPIDPTAGDIVLEVESTLFDTFNIMANIVTDSPDNIFQKVSSVTKVPTSKLSLYTRRGYEHLNVNTELRSGDILSLVLKNPQDYLGALATEYGAKTYNPVVPQTDMGISKFFSILKFICSKQKDNVNIPRLLSYVKKLTNCPPMVYALKLLYENSFLSLPCWVALVEGFYQFFKSCLSSFCNVEDKQVFEFSDYFWGLLIDKAETQVISGAISEDYDKLCLVCPISQLKIITPVTIPGCGEIFDRRSVLERIESDVGIAGCSKVPLTAEDMKPDAFTRRMLMYCPWHNQKDVYVWKRIAALSGPQCIRRVAMPCEWSELSSKLPFLRIAAPDGLFSGNECLTFIENGQLIYFMGFSKGKGSSSKVFNPVKCEYEYHNNMEEIATSKEALTNVTHDLTAFLKPEIKCRTPLEVLARAKPKPIVALTETESVSWEPEEVIVVLLDASGSMSSKVFDEEDSGFTRLQAAKDFFEAFANRSQAYDFHHSVGLTIFNTKITVTQKLTKIYEFFRESLEKVTANFQTCLNDAMMNAVKQIKEYTKYLPDCRRRILCLTDGCDNCSRTTSLKVTQTLQRERVVVDTVLITDSIDNVTQKSITHATGGACFLSKSRSEALKLFEMETLLSIRARVLPENIPTVRSAEDLKMFEDLTIYPYNSGQLPSNFLEGIQSTKTASADRILRLASLAMNLEESEAAAPNPCVQRILREINEFRRNPHTDIEIFPSEDSLTIWKILLRGPDATPYSGGVFQLCAKLPPTYPAKPPEVRFLTPIYHCNVNSSGRICHRVFGPSYTPSVTMRDILSCVCGLLMSPEPDDPLDSVLADEYHSSKPVYMEKARKWTQNHAMKKTYADIKKELAGGEEATGPDNLKCPLSGKLFEDPVISPSGHTYERVAILEHLLKHEGKDPATKQPLKPDQLTPNRAMKALVEQYKKGASRIAF